MRVEIPFTWRGRELLADVSASSPPFPRKGIAVHGLIDVATDADLAPDLWGTLDSLEIRERAEQLTSRFEGRYHPGIVGELRAFSDQAPHAWVRRLAEAAVEVAIHGRLGARLEGSCDLREGTVFRDRDDPVPIVEIRAEGRSFPFLTITPTDVKLAIADIQVVITSSPWEPQRACVYTHDADEPAPAAEDDEEEALEAFTRWLATRPGWAAPARPQGADQGVRD